MRSARPFIALLLLSHPALGGERVALLVGSDTGVEGEAPLRYTSFDVARMATVLTELGGFEAADVQVLSAPNAAEISQALERLSQRPLRAEMFIFYFSGHADSAALHPSGTRLEITELLERIRKVPAALQVAILDACQSGAATRAKGVVPGTAFDVRVHDLGVEGQILISSSAQDEQSFESEQHRGALFTLHWTAGLRGAADKDGDGRVALSEAYAYAYAQTLRSTLLSSGGMQHPTFRWDLAGRRDPVLTNLASSAQLTFVAEDEGSYVVLDGREQSVLAELQVGVGQRKRLALSPGDYVVSKRGPKDVRWARVSLGARDDRLLYDYQMRAVPMVRLAKKGPFTNSWAAASVGQQVSALSSSAYFATNLGIEWEQEHWLLGLQVLLSGGAQFNREVLTQEFLAGPAASGLYTLRWGPVSLRGGPALGLLLISQALVPQSPRLGWSLLTSARLRLDVSLATQIGIVLFGDAGLLWARAQVGEDLHGPHFRVGGDFYAFAWGSYGIGARLAW